MPSTDTKISAWQASQQHNTLRLALWTLGWVLTMAAVTFGPSLLWHDKAQITALAILVNVLVGFGMILANKRHLQGLDEMQRGIQLGAMGLTLGVGLVLGLAYSSLDAANLIAFDAEISHLVLLMGVTYLVAVFAGQRKFR